MGEKERELNDETIRLRAAICAIVEARDEQDFEALISAIAEAEAEAVISAVRASKEPKQ
jgi:hypothetical protein